MGLEQRNAPLAKPLTRRGVVSSRETIEITRELVGLGLLLRSMRPSVDAMAPTSARLLSLPHGAPYVPRVVPGGDVDAFVSGRSKGSDANEWPCRGTVVLHAPAHRVRPFAGDGTVTVVDEGRCALEAGSWSWGALAASFGRFEVAMEVVGPPELAEAFAVQAEPFGAAGSSAEESRRGS